MTAPIGHISFDLWCTLIRSHPEYKPAQAKLIRDEFQIELSVDEVLKKLRFYDRAVTRINEIVGGNVDSLETILLVVHGLGADLDAIAPRANTFYEKLESLFLSMPPRRIEPDFQATLAKLKGLGLTLNLLSNTGFIKGKTLRQLLAGFGWSDYFDFEIYSDEIECSKPDRGAFQAVWDQVRLLDRCDIEQVLHVGDNQIADVQGARQFGFSAACVSDDKNVTAVLKEIDVLSP